MLTHNYVRILQTLVPAVLIAGSLLPGGGPQEGIFSRGDAYERFMGRWSRELAPLLVKFARVRDGDAVLDVGSGTGALTTAVAAAAPSSRIVGIDPAASYVAFAKARHPADRIRFEVGDAQRLLFDDRTFDRTLSLLVLNFIPDRSKALDEMIRVTRRGGTVASAVWDYGQGMEMLRIFWDEAVALNPAADARDERHMPLSRQGDLGALWREHRLGTCRKRRSPFERAFPRSTTTGFRSSRSRARRETTWRGSRPANAKRSESGCESGSWLTGPIVRSYSTLVRGRCGASSLDTHRLRCSSHAASLGPVPSSIRIVADWAAAWTMTARTWRRR
jgi:SAM-dependent methyltransferase